MRRFVVAIVCSMMPVLARAESPQNPDGPPGTVWMDFEGRLPLIGKWDLDQIDESGSARASGFGWGLGFVAGPGTTIKFGIDGTWSSRDGYFGHDLSVRDHVITARFGVRLYLSSNANSDRGATP